MPRKYSHEIAASPHAACCGSIVKDQEYPEGLGRIGGLAVLSRRRQSHAPSSLKGRFSGDEFHAKMKSPPENLVSPLFYGTEKFFDFFQPTVESDFGNPKFTPAFASKDCFDKGPIAW